MPVDELDRLLNEESGLRALGGLDAPLDGDGPGGIDTLAFSGGVGENRSDVREAVADRLRFPRRLRGRGALLDQ